MTTVTAVPLQPLPRGSMLKLWIGILFVVLLAVGLAWLGTSKLQFSTLDNGVRYRVIESGTGEKVTPNDLVQLHFEVTKVSDGRVILSSARTGQPENVTANSFFPGLRDVMLELREGGVYQVYATAQEATGEPVPPGQPVQSDDELEFKLRVVRVAAGMGAMQGMMGPEGAGPGGPSGPPPGAMPPGAMPPGAMPPGAMPPGAMPPGAMPPGPPPRGGPDAR